MPVIPLDLRNGSVMLAKPSKDYAPSVAKAIMRMGDDYSFEIKWDGVRCLLLVENDTITLVGRNGRDETVRYPDLVENLGNLPNGTVLDGELLVFDGGTPVFNLVQRRNSQSNPVKIAEVAKLCPATFMAFDCLMVNYVDMRGTSLEARRMMLSNVVNHLADERLKQTPVSTDGSTMWTFVQEHQMEGLIAKANGSKYHSRRDDSWLKLKDTKRLTAILLDYDTGKGKRKNMIGALKLYLLNGGKPIEIGECGTGFTDAEAYALKVSLDNYALAVEHATEQGDKLPTPLLGEIEYQEVTKDMRLRMPRWRGLRHDIDVSECTTAQIGA